MGAETRQEGKGRVGGSGFSRPAFPEALAGVLAALNLILAASPQFEIYYLAPIGVMGASSIFAKHRKPFLGWALSFGAALLSLSVGAAAVASSVAIYPTLRSDAFSFLEANIVHLAYLALSVAAFLVSVKRKPAS
ncbi:MAG: hypothetical protein JTT11_06270 [Candidatus Brockarchaeota archaeon]|nr:hypothetical protein [Candidatus Brockarchaeota archaeon]